MAERPDRWIGIGLDRQIRSASSNPVVVEGAALAVWRAEQGPVNVWEDRCPHRGSRLSRGFVSGNMLRCIYHGWGYEPGGQCASIPAHPDLTPPKTICANIHPSIERYGIIWTNLSDSRSAPLPDVGAGNGWQPIRSLYVNRPPAPVREGLRAFDWFDRAAVEDIEDGVAFMKSPAGLSLLISVQPVDAGKTALHVVAKGDGVKNADGQLAMVARLERLRGAIEAR